MDTPPPSLHTGREGKLWQNGALHLVRLYAQLLELLHVLLPGLGAVIGHKADGFSLQLGLRVGARHGRSQQKRRWQAENV